jgi:hypothetical protein
MVATFASVGLLLLVVTAIAGSLGLKSECDVGCLFECYLLSLHA